VRWGPPPLFRSHLPVQGYLPKPYGVEDLARAVRLAVKV